MTVRPMLACSTPDCGSVWYQWTADHQRACRRAIKRGWDYDGLACICISRDVKCPDCARKVP